MKELNERELLLLAYLEGDLDEAGIQKAEAMMAEDAAMQFEYKQLKNTILKPETATVYPGKSRLKKSAAPKERASLKYVLWPMAIAASFALMILFYTPQTTVNGTGAVAVNNSNPVKENPAAAIETEKKITVATPSQNGATQAKIPTQNGTKQTIPPYAPVANGEVQTEQPAAKPTLPSPALTALAFTPPSAGKPGPMPLVITEIAPPSALSPSISAQENGWLAKAGQKVDKLMAYLQKPKLNIDKTESDEGKDYWTITLETEQYELEGRLFAFR